MPEVVALGEMLIDFVPTVSGLPLKAATTFVKAPGGAPANVAVGAARLGVSSGFVGQVGDDAFGRFLAETLQENGVDTQLLSFSEAARTALAFVSLMASGERDFMFYRNPSADMLYSREQVDVGYVSRARIFHFGSLTLIADPSREATLYAAEAAQASGVLVSYDPNLRLSLWPDAKSAREGLALGWSKAQVIKASEEEIVFMTGESDLSVGVRRLWHDDLNLLAVTRGAAGCILVTPRLVLDVPGFAVDVVDTTGAGDGFMAGLLTELIRNPSAGTKEELASICRFANAVGALTTTQRGAIPALPNYSQVQQFLAQRKLTM